MPSTTEQRITIDARKIHHSGIGRYIRNLLPGVIPRLTARRIVLLGNEETLSIYPTLDPRVEIAGSLAQPHSLEEQRLAWSSALRQTDLLWAPHYNVPLPYRGKLVVTIHDLAPIDLVESLNSFTKRIVAKYWLRFAANRASAILTPSNFSRNRIAELLTPKVPISVTPLAVDVAWPSLNKSPAAYSSFAPYFLFVGNIKPNKNLAGLLKAMEILSDRSDLQLIVVGKQSGFRTEDGTGKGLIERLGARVSFTGEVSDMNLISLYRGAIAFVMPSLYEGFGLPLLEAMRYGCPVIASETTSLPEVAGDAALLCDTRRPDELANCMRQILRPEIAQDFRQRGYLREAQFSYEQASQVTADVLNKALSS